MLTSAQLCSTWKLSCLHITEVSNSHAALVSTLTLQQELAINIMLLAHPPADNLSLYVVLSILF